MKRFSPHLPLGCLTAALPAALMATIAATGLAGQDLGSTLVRLSERSDAVVRARVLSSRVVGSEQRVVFKVRRTLKGTTPDLFTLTQAAGRSCGHALHGAIVGSGYLVFLSGDADRLRLTVGSSRAVVRIESDILGHVRALLAARGAVERLSVLTANLRSRNERVRRDAALALPIRRRLEDASNTDRARILAALGAMLGRDDRAALGLVQAVSRLRLRAAVPVLWNAYMTGASVALRRVFLEVLPVLDAAYVVDQIERRSPRDMKAQMRAITMLSHCPGRQAADCLRRMASSRIRAVATLAHEALAVQPYAGNADVVSPSHKFRSIDPRSRR
jgi:hypothetical protein